MTQLLVTYFGDDKISATFALVLFFNMVIEFMGHVCIKAGLVACSADAIFCLMAWCLVKAVYKENKKAQDEKNH